MIHMHQETPQLRSNNRNGWHLYKGIQRYVLNYRLVFSLQTQQTHAQYVLITGTSKTYPSRTANVLSKYSDLTERLFRDHKACARKSPA
jgi:hypothetical protein